MSTSRTGRPSPPKKARPTSPRHRRMNPDQVKRWKRYRERWAEKRKPQEKRWWGHLPASPALQKSGRGGIEKLERSQVRPRHALTRKPKFRPGLKDPVSLKQEKASCLIHGIKPEHLLMALQSGLLQSGFAREGRHAKMGGGKGIRGLDKTFGGFSAVFSRLVATDHLDAPCSGGSGVGGNPESHVQLILDPTLIERNFSLANGTDLGGRIPGTTARDAAEVGRGTKRIEDLWDNSQSESGRNATANGILDNPTWIAHNELLHHVAVPLENEIKGVVCSDPRTFAEMMSFPGAEVLEGDGSRGIIRFGDEVIPVLLRHPDDSLVQALKDEGIANDLGQVR